jgi:hypothetical protein
LGFTGDRRVLPVAHIHQKPTQPNDGREIAAPAAIHQMKCSNTATMSRVAGKCHASRFR